MTGLRIGIDARAAAEVPAGKGRYVRELVRALAKRDDPHEYVLYARRQWDEPLDGRFRWWLEEQPDAAWHRSAARAASSECDAFLATASYVTPWFLRIPCALVVHDLVLFQPRVGANRRAALIERVTIRRALSRSRVVLCDSESTRRDLVERFPRAAGKAVTVPLAAGREFGERVPADVLRGVRARYELERPFVLCTGTLEPRKNLVRVVDAFSQLPAELRAAYALTLVGPRGWEFEPILERARDAQALVLGHVPDSDLVALYQTCEVFCYPSLYEGFGLPLLEALSAGAPSITSNVSSLPEVGGDAVRYVDPSSVGEIAAALEELLRSETERERLRAAGPAQAARFSWDRVAEETLAQLTSIAR